MKFSDFKNGLNKEFTFNSKINTADRRYRDLDSILTVVKNINSTIVLEDVLAIVLTHAIEISRAGRGFIVLADESGNLEFKLGLDGKGNKLPEKYFRISQSVADDVFTTGKSRFIEGAQEIEGHIPTKSIRELSLQTILCAPLIADNTKIGVIYVDNKKFTNVKNREITFTFEILAEHASSAIRNAQLFNKIRGAKKKSEISQDIKMNFMAQMSHEVRTPLNTIINFSQLLKDELRSDVPPEIKSSLDLIESSGMRIIKNFDLLLNMAELNAGTYEFKPKIMDLFEKIILPVFNEYKSLAWDKKLEFKINRGTASLETEGDEYTLLLLFSNLVSNAIKFTVSGSVEIKIIPIKEINKISVELRDTGIGISSEFLENLSIQNVAASNYNGTTGIGLKLAMKYAEMNNVEFNITSQKGLGTSITLLFNSL